MKKAIRIVLCFFGLLALAEIGDFAWLAHVYATITTTASTVTAAGNGATTVFNYSFVAGQASYIQVTYTNSSGVATIVPSSQYTLVINPPAAGQVWGIGGNVTYPLVGSPIASGTTLTITRTVPLTQAVSSNQGQLFPLAVEQALDILEMEIQQIATVSGYNLTGNISDPAGLTYSAPPVAQRAGLIMAWDAQGNVIAASAAPSGIISSAMQPVVSASTLANGRSAFGLGSMATENINSGSQGGNSLQDDGSGNARVALPTVSDSVNTTVTCSFYLTQRIATGPITYTLPRANTCFRGFGFWVRAVGGGSITLTPNSNDQFYGQASGVSATIMPGRAVFVTTDAANTGTWYAAAKQGECINVGDLGAVGDGSDSDVTAVSAAFSALPSTGGALCFPPGKFVLGSQIAYTLSSTIGSISLRGSGIDSTILYFPNANTGLAFTLAYPGDSVHIRDMSITTGVANGGTAVSVTQQRPGGSYSVNDFTNVTFRGDDGGGATDYWTTALSFVGLCGISVENATFLGNSANTGGTGVALLGNTSPAAGWTNKYEIVVNINDSGFYSVATGLQYGAYVQGVTVNASNFTNGTNGISMPSSAGSGGSVPAQLSVVNSQFNLLGGDQIVLNAVTNPVNLSNNLFFVPNGHNGVNVGGSENVTITGNSFVPDTATDGTGIVANGAAVSIVGNIFNDLNTCVSLTSGGSLFSISGNIFQACSVDGVLVASTEVMISGNTFNGNGIGIDIPSTSNFVNIQSNFYGNNSTNHVPSSSTGNVVVGGGSP